MTIAQRNRQNIWRKLYRVRENSNLRISNLEMKLTKSICPAVFSKLLEADNHGPRIFPKANNANLNKTV